MMPQLFVQLGIEPFAADAIDQTSNDLPNTHGQTERMTR